MLFVLDLWLNGDFHPPDFKQIQDNTMNESWKYIMCHSFFFSSFWHLYLKSHSQMSNTTKHLWSYQYIKKTGSSSAPFIL